PVGSGKTVAFIKKAFVEAMRMRPIGPGNARRYVLGIWRESYKALWATTIRSWWKFIPEDMPGTRWLGTRGRPAEHIINFEDGWGPVEMIVRFGAFSEAMDPEELRGSEFTDAGLNEIDLMPKILIEAISGRVGRDPTRAQMGRAGRIFGDCNAPSVMSDIYQMFWQDEQDGFRLYRQPGAFEVGAENLDNISLDYYRDIVAKNAKNQNYVRRMVHNIPGVNTGDDIVYPEYDDVRHFSKETLPVEKMIPVTIGADGGLTPAAVFQQEMPDGQVRWLAEVQTERAGESAFAAAVSAVMSLPRFRGCEFNFVPDPATFAGEDTVEGSWASRVGKLLGLVAHKAQTNDVGVRHEAVRSFLTRTLDGGRPGFLLDPSCKGIRRGFLESYAFQKTRGTNDISSVRKSFDSHVHDAGQYCAMETGSARSRHRSSALAAERQARRQEGNRGGRYNPLSRGR
ncbi:MAG TPA: hypothetical protein PLJ34_04215, partial [Hyphomicrobiales bacterium]|nr:hypothetical protein [Hyphomicrobiales bacterium]